MSLTNTKVADTYKSLLRFDKTGAGAPTNDALEPLEDGAGNVLPVLITTRSGTDTGGGIVYTGTPDAIDGAQIWIGTHPDFDQTGTHYMTLSSEHLEIGSKQALEISSDDEVDMFSLRKLTMSGVVQLSGTLAGDVNYQSQKEWDGSGEAAGSMREIGGYNEPNEHTRNIDFAGNLTPQYNRTYTAGELDRTLRGVYVGIGGTSSYKPSEVADAGNDQPVPLKIGTAQDDEDTCLLTINTATKGLAYFNSSITPDADSQNQLVVQDIETINRSITTDAVFICKGTLTTVVDGANSATGQKLKLPDSAPGTMKIIIKNAATSAETLPIKSFAGADPITGAVTIPTGNQVNTYTFICTSAGWALISTT
jgi:hypothetical protein